MKKAVLILDCGATNVKACVVDMAGQILADYALPNETTQDPDFPPGLIWDIDAIWNKLCICSRKAVSRLTDTEIIGIAVTTFGVDGAAMKKDGTLCYPVISWQCSRTTESEKHISRYIDPDRLYSITGLQSYHFNTLYKLIWLHENRPQVLKEMDYYVLMPSLFIHRMTGAFVSDATMAGTSMLTDLRKRTWSEEILAVVGLTPESFPPFMEPGDTAGKLLPGACDAMGLKPGIPVLVAGHDTQFALAGSGASVNQPVLSSGTWDILMVRADAGSLLSPARESGITIELDSRQGIINPGVQWVSSGVLEWIGKMFFTDLQQDSQKYRIMIDEAGAVPAGSEGVQIIPELFAGGFSGKMAQISGFTHETTRAQVYRSTLEALCYYTKYGMEKLQDACHYSAKSIICVGGGSKNALWNQVRADVLGLPVLALEMNETTSLGAALVAFTALGEFSSIEEGFSSMHVTYTHFLPGVNSRVYGSLYDDYWGRTELNNL